MMSSSSQPRLTDFKVLIFDVYATLIDWETGIYDALQPLLKNYSSSSKWTREEALIAFSSVEKDLQAQHPQMLYRDLLANAHQVLESRLRAQAALQPSTTTLDGNPNPVGSTSLAAASTSDAAETSQSGASDKDISGDAHVAFAESIKNWPPFPDTFEALHALAKDFKLVVVSNVDRESFSHTLATLSERTPAEKSSLYAYPDPNPNPYWHPQTIPGSKSPFTLIFTAQDTLAYKPSLEPFERALEYIGSEQGLGIGKDQVLVVAQSLYHDHVPAKKLGLKTVWIDRNGGTMGVSEALVGENLWSWKFETLGEMAEAVGKEAN